MTEPSLQRLAPLHLEEVHAIEQAGQEFPWSRAHLAEALNDPQVAVWGAYEEDELLGFAILARQPFDAELQAVTVAPEARRRGIAKALMNALLNQARAWGSERWLLEVRVGNRAAITLYRRFGFSEDSRRQGYYPAASAHLPREDALLMSRPV
ncbi:ribosomal protein S18-alanine N-acetyltransferase [Litchfieldella xinjiangensis]|uniref:ribosomal protein S18-alanine N-acetyltransferase n=1 Tax=Litchfieldella xinjiangensis TaxID=1166948 RepID=UPI0005BE2881|nr:ribosomal protein S18-alanine N-acetyltransferase [Halomonas xinjiangensis]